MYKRTHGYKLVPVLCLEHDFLAHDLHPGFIGFYYFIRIANWFLTVCFVFLFLFYHHDWRI